ncbi:YciI family protein [Actinotalea sp. C106]|uniref:YciI family protein n=1 Tax=Actinotalea sp. C106 TaxID=2908644 RepID=UPI002028C476|nr:YciI family protein [Actinotalea sp. C106]
MKYLILIHQNRAARAEFAAMPQEVQAAGLQAYVELNSDLAAAGELVSAEALADDSTSTVVSLRSGALVTSDGPFAESKEMLAGYYLVDVTSRERAVEIAARIPEVAAGAGDVEIRPVMDYSTPDA